MPQLIYFFGKCCNIVMLQQSSDGSSGQVKRVMLRLFGTEEMPPIMKVAPNHRRSYNYQLRDLVKERFVSNSSTH